LIKYNHLLEDFFPEEVKGAGEFKFIEWLFLLQQLTAIMIILGVLVNALDAKYVGPVLEVVSQNSVTFILVLFLCLHAGVILIVFLLRRPLGFYLLIGFLAGSAGYSVLEILFGSLSGYNIAGIFVSFFWIVYLVASNRIRVRCFYQTLFARATYTIYCPGTEQETILDAEICDKELTDGDRFKALCERITSTQVPQGVRVAQIALLAERFGGKAIPFLKKQFENQKSSGLASARIVSALAKALQSAENKG